MKKYQPGDTATFYFVIKNMDNNKIIQGWTDDKDIAKFYLEFHKCKYFKLKSITNTIEEIIKIIEENWNDEIRIFHVTTKNRNSKGKKDDDTSLICIPATETEFRFIREEITTFMSSSIDYGFINEALPYLKKKYQNALTSILLVDIIRKVVYSKDVKHLQNIEFDSIMVLLESFPENFGE